MLWLVGATVLIVDLYYRISAPEDQLFELKYKIRPYKQDVHNSGGSHRLEIPEEAALLHSLDKYHNASSKAGKHGSSQKQLDDAISRIKDLLNNKKIGQNHHSSGGDTLGPTKVNSIHDTHHSRHRGGVEASSAEEDMYFHPNDDAVGINEKEK